MYGPTWSLSIVSDCNITNKWMSLSSIEAFHIETAEHTKGKNRKRNHLL